MNTLVVILLVIISLVVVGFVASKFIVVKENTEASAEKLVAIGDLTLVPWLGELKDRNGLAEKFEKEKADFISYVQYDLQEAVKLQLSYEEASQVVNLMGAEMKKETLQESVIPDKTVFKSMGWKSEETNQVMRTANPVLELGRETAGFQVKIMFHNREVEYVFLKEQGNLALQDISRISFPEAAVVPSAATSSPATCLLASVGYPTIDAWRRAGCLNRLEKANKARR